MHPRRVNPTDNVEGLPDEDQPTVMEFWRWAYGDLCDDDVKGVFAEWLVHHLLGIRSPRRISWANSDIITDGGVRIEVKSTSYWQSWKLLDERGSVKTSPTHSLPDDDSKVRFSGLQARDSVSTERSSDTAFKSQLYVFAFQRERSIERWNALDLAQWEFFLVPRTDLEALGRKSISLSTLRARFGSLTAGELAESGRKAIRMLEGVSAASQETPPK